MPITPKNLFLIDGLGALLSAFLLGVVLVKLQSLIGMPTNQLYFLAAIPCFFALYDLICYFGVGENWRPYLKGIAIANLLYCVLSIGLLIFHFPKLTGLGVAYFVIEILIVVAIAWWELKTVSDNF